ncbi:uncharacterized protein PHALS_04077 [Plasmopara halstedii]|uniref:Uncharacterized protein n=1 Tax=Plasmopara halstedii TaxID=4781 RepID=A0A0P1A9Q4_PLAHL|nr:uncharacterized protein PHALS_04077 [Plasmopara halstedii]CEG36820.1 hypothetical protein PHALS_04077 [Plasmopara halstedii]|eukprot:XP_024573189.1 hypothetical protein PHALS_04077 [Plasmopara halstedii]
MNSFETTYDADVCLANPGVPYEIYLCKLVKDCVAMNKNCNTNFRPSEGHVSEPLAEI